MCYFYTSTKVPYTLERHENVLRHGENTENFSLWFLFVIIIIIFKLLIATNPRSVYKI